MSIARPIGLSESDEPPENGARTPDKGDARVTPVTANEAGRVTPVMEQ